LFVTRWEVDVDRTVTLDVGGSYDFVIDWGDCTRERVTPTSGSLTHEYAMPGSYRISAGGQLGTWEFSHGTCFESDYDDGSCIDLFHRFEDQLVEIAQWGTFQPIGYRFFHTDNWDCDIEISALDAPVVLDARQLFWRCTVRGDISHWDLSALTNFSMTFDEADIAGLDISGWDTSSAVDMSGMFSSSTFIGDISDWDVSNVTTMESMFSGSAFDGDISSWNTSNATNMSGMFWVSQFDGDISSWDTSNVVDMGGMFENSSFDGDVSQWNVSSVTDATDMFTHLSTPNYDALLLGWSTQVLQPAYFGAGTSQYSAGSAAAARAVLDQTWSITDGGQAP